MKKINVILGLTLAVGTLLTGCGKSAADTTITDEAVAKSSTEVKKVVIANAGGPKPYNWVAEDGTLAGYEPEVLRAVDELLPEYEFEFEQTEFASIFTGIDSGLYDAGFNWITKKPEREEKYYFANEPHMYVYKTVVVRKGDTSIQGIDDLGGKTVYSSGSGSATDLYYEDYNEAHPDNPINIVFTSADTLKYYQDLVNGKIDLFFSSKPGSDAFFESYPEFENQVDIIQFSKEETQEIEDPYGWFIYPKTEDGAALRDAVDEALRTLKENGTLSELSKEYLGFDFVDVD